jgi:transcriptional/translational regulatory protein YebC/TACO1
VPEAEVEEIMLQLMEVPGVVDVEVGEDGEIEVYTDIDQLKLVEEVAQGMPGTVSDASLVMKAKDPLELSEAEQEKVWRFLEAFEDSDEVQNVYCNAV